MKPSSKSRLASLFAVAVLSIAATSSALAEYRLTAFGNTIGYRSLLSADVKAIESTFAGINLSGLDHFEANNLCVAQILLNDFDEAISSCEAALVKAGKSFSTRPMAINSATASIYSNMAVAKALSGDKSSAVDAIEAALSYQSGDKNINTNYSQISSTTSLTASIH